MHYKMETIHTVLITVAKFKLIIMPSKTDVPSPNIKIKTVNHVILQTTKTIKYNFCIIKNKLWFLTQKLTYRFRNTSSRVVCFAHNT